MSANGRDVAIAWGTSTHVPAKVPKVAVRLSAIDVLNLTNGGKDVFDRFVSGAWRPKKVFQNPFVIEKQRTPSFNIFQLEGERWRFKDHKTGDAGDCFEFVQRLRGISFEEAVQVICEECNLIGSLATTGAILKTPPAVHVHAFTEAPRAKNEREREQGAVCFRSDFTPQESAYWEDYGITKATLEVFGVKSAVSCQLGPASKPMFATDTNPFFIYTAADQKYKVYRPLGPKKERFRWINGQASGYVFGLEQLPEQGALVIIAAGEKDAMTLYEQGYAAVTVGSEVGLLPQKLIEQLRGRFKQVLIGYDSDATGRKWAKANSEAYGIGSIDLPASLATRNGKDVSDFFRDVKKGSLNADEFHQAVKEASLPHRESINPVPTVRMRSARQRLEDAKNQPPLLPLFGPFWETPGISILAGDTGVGKSVLAVLIAHLISSDHTQFLGQLCTVTTVVQYYDFELSDRQFAKRFDGLQMTDKFLIGDAHPLAMDPNITFAHIAEHLMEASEGQRVVIIDNISAMALKSTIDADVSLAVMRGLKQLQVVHGVSSLVLAHVPKIPRSVALDINHLAGSKKIADFADSVFFIGRSCQGPNLRYIKQVKNRTGELKQGVLVCEITEAEGFLNLRLISLDDDEKDHLFEPEPTVPTTPKRPTEEVLATLWAHLQTRPSIPQQAIAERMGMSVGWVNKWKQILTKEKAGTSEVKDEDEE